MSLSQICGDIKNREIVLYGNCGEIKEFLDAYGSVLKIKCVVTDYKEEVKIQAYAEWGVETCLLENSSLQEELIVVCNHADFEVLQKRLTHIGKKEYVEYISSSLVETLVYHKKLFVGMGTQLIEQICMVLSHAREITDAYSILYFAESEILEVFKNRLQEYKHICRFCDIYVRSACEKQQFEQKIVKGNDLQSQCRVVTVADYGFSGYFPQVEKNRDRISDYLLRERERLDMSYETLAFSRVDYEILKRCQADLEIEEIVLQLLKEEQYTYEEVKENFAKEVQRFKEKEKHDDIKLGDFIENNRKQCLCRNLNEWNEPLISYVVRMVTKVLGMPEVLLSVEEIKQLIEENSGSELLIYPSVQKHLKLEEAYKDKLYRVQTYRSTRYMTMEEYMHYLVTYTYKAQELMQYTKMDQMFQE